MTFTVGMKVVAVRYDGNVPVSPTASHEPGLVLGRIYTVREIDPAYIAPYGFAGIRVEEYRVAKTSHSGQFYEPATLACYFRPVVSRKTDISIFTAMLKPSDVTVEAMRIADHVRELTR